MAWIFLVAQWIRICLPMRRTQVQSMVQKDSTCCGATKTMCHNSCSLHTPVCCEHLSATTEGHAC